jgi:uncharacterized protein (TIGR04255 family)
VTDAALSELLDLPEVPEVIYQRPPLALVLCQVRFPAVLDVSDPRVIAPLQRALRRRYPLVREANIVQVQLIAGQAQPLPAPPAHQWQFSDAPDGWQVVVTRDFVTLETRTYESFADFLERLGELLTAVAEHLQPQFVSRIGLRYINEIRDAGMAWDAVLRPELLGALASLPIAEDATTQSVSVITLRNAADQGLNIQHGLFPAGHAVNPRPSDPPKSGPFFLLDFDAFRELGPFALSFDPAPICAQVDQFHKQIYALFRWSLSDAYVRSLGVRR